MAVRTRKVVEPEVMPYYDEASRGIPQKSLLEKMAPVMAVVIVIGAFVLGSMWSKLKYLESSSAPSGTTTGQAGNVAAPNVNSKYKSFAEAMKDYAKQTSVDGNKLMSCVNSGSKKAIVDADLAEGGKVGVQGTPGFFINGRLLAGAYPFEEFKKIIDEELTGKADKSVTRATVSVGNAPTQGTKGAPITLIEYSDFQCPFCSRAFPTVQQILKEYSGKVLFAYKHFPLSQIHPNAQKSAEAAECAKDQGKFWEFHDKLFEDQTQWANLPQT
ncbi:hypothetical protein A2634_01875 [Candidatus Amesbacteria bacterium RIFCSPHIGHO2_01_FULL_48_32]|uniref:Thioredoxin domain-containing protein n=1 Tax=Candidatus Amesbacteria bacterium RIFCSPLOWO2_01_FULL_48_25 TaxID=1797259 RepID=A0A1F4ZD75_9BACT|nr:MAG: hypothetical protein A2634_01875 [Candidatus Amesbacteria bacterium RIFCSPHIGHO2_01_FULL_48_32]OGD04339.1 MAG: hypothetical protein A2989_04875 [Candidatus Amesbacteria bacterium RIFCSPLOWO2_01_FULL_48_25]HJZ06173.1 thioredoxin domain-containing protein [Patescibacteria group bacterium]